MWRAFSALTRRSATTTPLSESQIRALSHEELLEYALKLSRGDGGAGGVTQREDDKTVTNNGKNNGRTNEAVEATNSESGPAKKRRKRKELDWSRYGTRSIALRVSYLGWNYHGFASQPHSTNTVEHYLFSALTKTHLIRSREECAYSRAGRTDVGVSARSQVVGLRVRSNVAPPAGGACEMRYATVLNAVLPPEIRVTAWAPVDGQVYAADSAEIRSVAARMRDAPRANLRRPGQPFSARFDATWRAYRYYFIADDLDVAAMRKACGYFVGTHNFRNFCKVDKSIDNFERVMYEVDVRDVDGEVAHVYVRGQAFLWHQVRCMVAILFEVGKGRESPEIVAEMLKGEGVFANGKPAYRMASPTPLVLDECVYPPCIVQFVVDDDGITRFEKSDSVMTSLYVESRLRAAVTRGFLEANDGETIGESSSFRQVRKRRRNYFLDMPLSNKHTPLKQRAIERASP